MVMYFDTLGSLSMVTLCTFWSRPPGLGDGQVLWLEWALVGRCLWYTCPATPWLGTVTPFPSYGSLAFLKFVFKDTSMYVEVKTEAVVLGFGVEYLAPGTVVAQIECARIRFKVPLWCKDCLKLHVFSMETWEFFAQHWVCPVLLLGASSLAHPLRHFRVGPSVSSRCGPACIRFLEVRQYFWGSVLGSGF